MDTKRSILATLLTLALAAGAAGCDPGSDQPRSGETSGYEAVGKPGDDDEGLIDDQQFGEEGLIDDQEGIVDDQEGLIDDEEGLVDDEEGLVPDESLGGEEGLIDDDEGVVPDDTFGDEGIIDDNP